MADALAITREDVRSWSPCGAGTEAFIESCFGDRKSLTFQDLCDIPQLSHEHLLWTALRPQVIRPDRLECIRSQFLQIIGEAHPSYTDWRRLSTVDLIGKVVRARPGYTPDETYATMVEIMRAYHAD